MFMQGSQLAGPLGRYGKPSNIRLDPNWADMDCQRELQNVTEGQWFLAVHCRLGAARY
jgi:hypothetical protein